jgi:hypothetical protein
MLILAHHEMTWFVLGITAVAFGVTLVRAALQNRQN